MFLRQSRWWIGLLTFVMAFTLWGSASVAQAQAQPCGDSVTVVVGDTLWEIAQRCNTTVEEIIQANPEIDNRRLIYVGQELQMPGADGAPDDEQEIDPVVAAIPLDASGDATVQVIATGFPASQPVNIGFGPPESEYEVVQTATTDADGALNVLTTVPAYFAPGDEWVLVVQTADLEYRALTTAEEPLVTMAPLSGPAGTTVEIIANNYPPNVPVIVGVGLVQSEYTVVEQPLTSANGALSASVPIPDSAQAGQRWVVVVETEDRVSRAITAPFEVTDGSPGDGSGGDDGAMFTRTNIFLVALNDQGQTGQEIGCGDSVIPVEVAIEPTRAPLTAALEELFAINTEFYGQSGLYNALYQSDLTLDGIDINGTTAEIALSGSLLIGGTCDAPRVEEQLRQTALQYSTIDQVVITLNGQPLDAALSER